MRRTISKPIPDDLVQVIDATIAAGLYERERDYLVPSRARQRRSGERDDRVIWSIIRDVAARAEVDTHVQALRAAFAVHYLESNPGELLALKTLMGHEHINTTILYLRRLDRAQQMETVRDLSWFEASASPR